MSIDSPSCAIFQNGICTASVNSFIRQALLKPLATKCIGTNRPVWNCSMNCLAPREVIFMEMTYKYVHRLTLGQNHRHTIGGIHPIIEDQYAGLGLHCKTTMKDICQFHDSHSDLRLNLWILSWTIWNRYVSSYRPKKNSFSLILLYLSGLTNLIFNLHAKDIHDFFNRR